MDRARYAELFLDESREHLARVDRLLLELEASGLERGGLEEVFRSVHTLKGMAAAMGYARSAELAHAVEQLLDPLRAGTLGLDAEVVDALFQGVDQLERTLAGEHAAPGADGSGAPAAHDPAPQAPRGAGEGGGLRVTVLVSTTAPLPAVRAVLALRRARELGAVSELDPPEELLLTGEFGGVLGFSFAGELEEDELRAALLAVGEIARVEVERGGGEAGEAAAPAGPGAGALVRVAQRELDALLDQVGEMIVARDRLRALAERRADPELDAVADQLARLVAEQRDEVLRMRMAPVSEVFGRFPRLVRDAARELERRVALEVEGGDVRLDRALLVELGDLLVHLLRNAVDHGIEPPEERAAAGKAEQGLLLLSARREHAQIVVVVRDDGRGIARERVRAEAEARGIAAGALREAELLELLTRPGFSTAARVTSLSGRGVGLDVVRTRVQALGGSLSIASEPGRGTAFTLRLPLSLTMTRALVALAGGESYAVPLAGVAEVAEVGPGEADRFALRGEPLPLLDLRALLATGAGGEAGGRWNPVLVLTDGARRAGLLVDALEGQVEAVIKPFDAPRALAPVFAGATVRSDGRVSLILDVPRLLALAHSGPAAPTGAATNRETLC